MSVDQIIEQLRQLGRPFALLVDDPDQATTQAVRITVHAPEGASQAIQTVDHLSQALTTARATITNRGRALRD